MAERKRVLIALLGKLRGDEGPLAAILDTLPDDSVLLMADYQDRDELVGALWRRDQLMRAGQDHGSISVVSQTFEHDRVFVHVLIQGPGQYQFPAELLFDTGCTMELVISEYKAQQLGMQPDEPQECRVISLAGGSKTTGIRYNPVKVVVLESDNEASVLGRSGWLEAYCMAGTQGVPLAGPPVPLPPGMVHTLQGADEAQAAGTSGTPAATKPASNVHPVFKLRLQLSPARRGRDSQGYDVILGKPGMSKLGIGMNKEGRLYALAQEDQIISVA